MELWSLIIGVASLVVGIISIILAVVAMVASNKESERSAENYKNTKELLNKIESRSELIDRAIQIQQAQLVQIINKALDKIGQSPIDFEPITEEEIKALFEEKTKPIDSKIQELKSEIDSMPKVHIGNQPSKNMKNGDIRYTLE